MADIVTLQHRTEGWAAGLQLASLSLEQRQERAAFIRHFSGSQRDVAEFLAHDVLARQPKEMQEFLLETLDPRPYLRATCRCGAWPHRQCRHAACDRGSQSVPDPA